MTGGHQHADKEQPMSDANWLPANCQDLLYVPATARRQAAVNLGARAADEG
ncbi:hypothetical protein NKG94_51140 [Micromonospora sp. M12]